MTATIIHRCKKDMGIDSRVSYVELRVFVKIVKLMSVFIGLLRRCGSINYKRISQHPSSALSQW